MKLQRDSLQERAAKLLALHTDGGLLVLPNVWDPISARIMQEKGFPAVATASAAVSASLGYEDGEKITRATLIDAIARIARSVDVPVTADIEGGYARTIPELEETARAVIGAGAVGINLEDALEEGGPQRPVEEQCARIAAVRATAAARGVHLVINARIDSFLSSSFTDAAAAMEDAVARAAEYSRAGADCVYPIGPGDESIVRELRARIPSPMNILGSPAAAPLAVLESIGVERVSFGPFVFRSCMRKLVDIADALAQRGDYSCIEDRMTRAEIGAFLKHGPEPDPQTGGTSEA